MGNNETFNYTYSAKEQHEIKAIREKYIAPEKTEDDLTKLRRLDSSVTKKATVVSLVLGLVGALILGTGLSLAMTDIGEIIGLFDGMPMIVGIIVGVIGIVLVCLAYPTYDRIVKKERKRIAPEIIRLTDELMK